MPDPFKPPSSRLADPAAGKGSAARALALGFLVDVGGSIITGSLLFAAYVASVSPPGATPEQIEASLKSLPVDSWLSIVGTLAGLFFSGLGGYVCARIARHSEFALGAILAAASILFGLFIGGLDSLLEGLVLSLFTFLAVMLGVRIAVSRNNASA